MYYILLLIDYSMKLLNLFILQYAVTVYGALMLFIS